MVSHIRNRFLERWAVRTKTAWDWTVAKLVGLLLHWLKKLPPEKSTNTAEKLGRFLAPILPRTTLARKNMQAAFPEKSKAEIDQLVRGLTVELRGGDILTVAEFLPDERGDLLAFSNFATFALLLIVLPLALITGFALSNRVFKRIEGISETAAAVSLSVAPKGTDRNASAFPFPSVLQKRFPVASVLGITIWSTILHL